jgi:hypothetical protein
MSSRPVSLLVLGLLVACAAPDAPPAEDATEVALAPAEFTVTMTDNAFSAADTIAPGMTAIRIVNQGAVHHQMILARIDSGRTMADVEGALSSPETPGWIVVVGGGGAIPAGASNVAVSDLSPGLYVMLCFLQNAPDQPPHFVLGMVRPLVVAGERPDAAAPVVTGEIAMHDYGFDLPTLTAGPQVLRVVNNGKEIHEIHVARIPEGMTFDQFMASLTSGAEPVGEDLGGNGALSPGLANWWQADLAAGTYAVLCFVPSPDGTPHMMKGMAQPLVVSAAM